LIEVSVDFGGTRDTAARAVEVNLDQCPKVFQIFSYRCKAPTAAQLKPLLQRACRGQSRELVQDLCKSKISLLSPHMSVSLTTGVRSVRWSKTDHCELVVSTAANRVSAIV